MWRVTLTGVVAHRLRYALTALAVLLGVAFMAGTFVLNDTITATFNGLYSQIYQGTSAVVRAAEPFGPGAGFSVQRQRIPASLAGRLAGPPPAERPPSAWPGPASRSSTPCGCCQAGGRRGQVPRW